MKISENHIDLLKRPIKAILSTIDNTGQPNSRFTHCDYENGKIFLVFPKNDSQYNNLKNNKKISLTIIDPLDDTRWMSITGNVSIEKQDMKILCNIEPIKITAFHTR